VDGKKGLLVLQDGDSSAAFSVGRESNAYQVGQRVHLRAHAVLPQILSVPGFPLNPSQREHRETFAGPAQASTHFVARGRAFLVPPVSGDYIFALNSDDSSELWLSTDDNPAHAQKICFSPAYTSPHEWTRYASQRSAPVHLEAGRRYYIESLHEQGRGAQHLEVAWMRADLPRGPIPTECLQPWSGSAGNAAPPHGVLLESWSRCDVRISNELNQFSSTGAVYEVADLTAEAEAEGAALQPVPLPLGPALDSSLKYRLVEASGVVTFIARDGPELTLELSSGEHSVVARIQNWLSEHTPPVKGFVVRLQGVCEPGMDADGNPYPHTLWIPSARSIDATAPAAGAADARTLFISEINELDLATAPRRRIRAVGVVQSQTSPTDLTLRDEGAFYGYSSTDGEKWEPLGPARNITMPDEVYVGFAVASTNTEQPVSAVFEQFSGFGPSFDVSEIGGTILEKHFSQANGRIHMAGRGEDIWDMPDRFLFAWHKARGPIELVAKIGEMNSVSPWSKAGLIARAGLANDAPFADVLGVGPNLTAFQWRTGELDTAPRSVYAPTPSTARWLKLARRYHTLRVALDREQSYPAGTRIEVLGYAERVQGEIQLVNAYSRERAPDNFGPPRPPAANRLDIRAVLDESPSRWPGRFRIRGVVTASTVLNGRHYLSLQDSTGGIFLEPLSAQWARPLSPGDFVEVASTPSYYDSPGPLPPIGLVFLLGKAPMPKPIEHPLELLMPRRGDGYWTEIEGIVTSAQPGGSAIVRHGSGTVRTYVKGLDEANWQAHVDERVRLRGVTTYRSGAEQLLLVPGPEHMETLENSLDIASAASRPIAALAPRETEPFPLHRVKTRGVATFVEGNLLFIQDATGAAIVDCLQAPPARVGDEVVVVGFPEICSERVLALAKASLVREERSRPLETPAIALKEIAGPKYAGKRVRLEALALHTAALENGALLELQGADGILRARVSQGSSELIGLPVGTRIAAVGVLVPEIPTAEWAQNSSAVMGIQPYRFLIGSADDVTILERPSWWRLRRTLFLIGGLVILSVAAFAWVHVLRRRVRQRTQQLEAAMTRLRQEAQLSATLAERNRLAGEIHDSLEQGFSGLMLQLDATTKHPHCPPEVRDGLALARGMVSFSRDEVRHAVWDLQSPILDEADLSTALNRLADQLSNGNQRVVINSTGAAHRLPSRTEHHLLRIGQEAIANAVKHARATTININLTFATDSVTLTVSDDGVGFATGAVLGGTQGHFGLRSLRSRAKKINGQLSISSELGKGSVVEIRVPACSAAEISLSDSADTPTL
jgi:signal transduction histidine kinase